LFVFERPSAKSEIAFSRSCFFHFAIWFGCTLCRKAISAVVEIPRIASKATFALKSAEKLFRMPFIVDLSPFPEKIFYRK
jgi:hypothetical protein